MKAKLIRYKNVTLDYFTVYGDWKNVEEEEWYEGDNIDTQKADSLSSQICPWCIKKYGLYSETETTPEYIDDDIAFYDGEDKEELDWTCGVSGCSNGAAIDFWVNWKDCEIVG